MNKEQIIQMARESSSMEKLPWNGQYIFKTQKELLDFTAAIRSATKEEDAKICDVLASDFAMREPQGKSPDWFDCSEAIRASK